MATGFDVSLLDRDDLERAGMGPRALSRALASGDVVKVRPGVFVRATDVRSLHTEDRVVVRARALHRTSVVPPVFAGVTAAALLGHPLHGVTSSRLHVVAAEGRPGGGRGVSRHDGTLPADEVVEVGGLLATSPARTVADVGRSASYETALCIADAALRVVAAPRNGMYDTDAVAAFRAAVADVNTRFSHGVGRCARVMADADGRAQRPGETISRIRLRQLGFRDIALQVHVPAPDGGDFWVDFGLEDVRALGEFDGKGKYHSPEMRGGLSTAAVFDREKQREDWIRGVTQRSYVRWGWEHLRGPETLGSRLRAFGVAPPSERPTR